MYFSDEINIPKETIEKFGKVPLPADFQALRLKKTEEVKDSYLGYDLYLTQGGKIKKIGQINMTKRRLTPMCQKTDGSLAQLKGYAWDRRLEMVRSTEGMPTYGNYGMTMAMVLAFMQQLDKNGIESVTSFIKADNVPSLRLSEKMMGLEGRLTCVDVREQDGKQVITPQGVYAYVVPVKDTVARMMTYQPKGQTVNIVTQAIGKKVGGRG